MRLAIITTHPIQYNAPFFALLAREPGLSVKVFYTWSQTESDDKFDPGFGKVINWDIPLLSGYDYLFVKNVSLHPGSHHFRGIINPDLLENVDLWNPDAIMVYGWSFHSHLKCIRHYSGKKILIFRGDSTLLDDKIGFRTILRRIFLKWLYRRIDYALYTGTHNKAYFMAFGMKENQLLYAPHSIDNIRFSENDTEYSASARELRKVLGFLESDIVLLFAGKLEKKKSPFFLLSFLNSISDKRIKLLFVGNGILEEALKKKAAKNDRVVFMDFQNQTFMPVIYRVADLFVLPSEGPGETWGLALNEAMACGRAVAAGTKVGGAPDLIEPGVNGVIFSNEEPSALTDLLMRSLKDQSVLMKMGQASARRIGQFDFNLQKRAIMQILNRNIKK